MFSRTANRIGVVVLAAVLAMAVATPAGAKGWGEGREFVDSLVPRIFAWLDLTPNQGAELKCDGGSIDPNGCPKKADVQRTEPDGDATGAKDWARVGRKGRI
jgi:hypothetical protein